MPCQLSGYGTRERAAVPFCVCSSPHAAAVHVRMRGVGVDGGIELRHREMRGGGLEPRSDWLQPE